jgi:hypothetical protein
VGNSFQYTVMDRVYRMDQTIILKGDVFMNRGKFENMLLAAGYKPNVINEMVADIQRSEPDLSREDVCESEVQSWSY